MLEPDLVAHSLDHFDLHLGIKTLAPEAFGGACDGVARNIDLVAFDKSRKSR